MNAVSGTQEVVRSKAERTAPTTATAGTSPRRHPVRRPLPDHLPREDVVHHPGDACPCCGGARLLKLGEDVTEVLERIPARLSCRWCETMIRAPAPDLPIERGRPGPALVADVVVGKYIDGLPLYRRAGIIARDGVDAAHLRDFAKCCAGTADPIIPTT